MADLSEAKMGRADLGFAWQSRRFYSIKGLSWQISSWMREQLSLSPAVEKT